MSQKYIKCDCCGRKIPMGSDVWYHDGYCGIYCSQECYADSWGCYGFLDEKMVENCDCTVYDDEQQLKELEQKRARLMEELAKTQFEIDCLT